MTTKKARHTKGQFSLKTTALLILLVFFIGAGTTLMYYSFYTITHMTIYDIQLKTMDANHIRFDAGANLNFGALPAAGAIAKKEINLANTKDVPIEVDITITGTVSPFIQLEENNFILQPGETKKLPIYAIIPLKFNKLEEFSGEAKIRLVRI